VPAPAAIQGSRDVLVIHIEACMDFTLENGKWPFSRNG
jgi:hypothetical protein